MNIETRDFETHHEVNVIGNLGYGNWHLIVDEVMEVFESGVDRIFLNWSTVTYFDSSGLQSLVAIYNYIKKNPDKYMALVTDNDEHIKILNLISFEKLFPIFSSIDDAKENLIAV